MFEDHAVERGHADAAALTMRLALLRSRHRHRAQLGPHRPRRSRPAGSAVTLALDVGLLYRGAARRGMALGTVQTPQARQWRTTCPGPAARRRATPTTP